MKKGAQNLDEVFEEAQAQSRAANDEAYRKRAHEIAQAAAAAREEARRLNLPYQDGEKLIEEAAEAARGPVREAAEKAGEEAFARVYWAAGYECPRDEDGRMLAPVPRPVS